MEIKVCKEKIVEFSNELEGTVLLVKKVLLDKMTFNQNSDDYEGSVYALESENDVLELTYRLVKLSELVGKIAA